MRISIIIAVLFVHICAVAEKVAPSAIKPGVFVLTDISNELDDEESVVQPFSAPTAASRALM